MLNGEEPFHKPSCRELQRTDLQCWGAGVERAPVFRPEMNRTPHYAMNLNILITA